MVAWDEWGQGPCIPSHFHDHFPSGHCCLASPQGPLRHTDKPRHPSHQRTLQSSCPPQLYPRPWETPTHLRAQGSALASAAHRALGGGAEVRTLSPSCPPATPSTRSALPPSLQGYNVGCTARPRDQSPVLHSHPTPDDPFPHTPLPGWLLTSGFAPLAPYLGLKLAPQGWREGQGEPLGAPA